MITTDLKPQEMNFRSAVSTRTEHRLCYMDRTYAMLHGQNIYYATWTEHMLHVHILQLGLLNERMHGINEHRNKMIYKLF